MPSQNRREDGRPEEQQPVAAPVAHAEHVRDGERRADEHRHDEEAGGLDRQEREGNDSDRGDRRIDVPARDGRRLVVQRLVGRVAGEHGLGRGVEDAEVERNRIVLDRADEERHTVIAGRAAKRTYDASWRIRARPSGWRTGSAGRGSAITRSPRALVVGAGAGEAARSARPRRPSARTGAVPLRSRHAGSPTALSARARAARSAAAPVRVARSIA